MFRHSSKGLAAAALAAMGCVVPALAGDVGSVSVTADGLSLAPAVDYGSLVVSVAGPNGWSLRRDLDVDASTFVSFGTTLADGTYTYELRSAPRADAATRDAQARARETGTEALLAGRLRRGAVQSGVFTVLGGQVVPPDLREPQTAVVEAAAAARAPDTTFTDSVCVGFDCPASPSFGDSTILLMENNTRIKFDDTSAAPFPNQDWALVANETASGGANRFSVQNCGVSSQGGCSGNSVLSLTAGAPNNALFVDAQGELGLGTATPAVEIHTVDGDSPALRLEQDGSSGFTPQAWDLAGNETNFFIRDVTHGSKLPFRIQPNAPSNSIFVSNAGNVGVGTSSPSKPLHLSRSDGTAQVLVTETNAAVVTRTLLSMTNNGPARMTFSNGAAASTWAVDNDGSSNFVINKIDGDPAEVTVDGSGNVVIAGTLTQNSDRDTKAGIDAVDPQAVLARVSTLPISTWHLRTDAAEVKHMGPMAQDFAAAFGLGASERHIAPVDMGGVALAAIQALHEAAGAKDARIAAQEAQLAELRRSNAELAERLAAIERALADQR